MSTPYLPLAWCARCSPSPPLPTYPLEPPLPCPRQAIVNPDSLFQPLRDAEAGLGHVEDAAKPHIR